MDKAPHEATEQSTARIRNTMKSLHRLLIALLVLFFNWKSYHYVLKLRQVEENHEIDKESIDPTRPLREQTMSGKHEYGSPLKYDMGVITKSSEFRSPNRANRTSSMFPSQSFGYAPTGGRLPTDGLPHYPNPQTWPRIDNGTCIGRTSEPIFDWQKRAPHAILLGTMKGGTHALSEYLWEHPLVANPKDEIHEMHFYDGKKFSRDAFGIPQKKNQLAYAQRVQAKYPTFFDDKGLYSIHDSPRYLLWSDRIPDAILCVTPWAKLMTVLRDPVERAISHYRFQDQARRKKNIPMVDWEGWINDDLQLLRRAGVVQDWAKVDFEEFSGSDNEVHAWKTYLRNPSSQMIVGRGLYAIQIGQYFAAMDRVGKARSELLVLRSEELKSNTQEVFDSVLDFLELPPHQLGDKSARHETGKNENLTEIPSHLRKELEDLFTPYNRRLSKLLGWEDVWEY